MSYSSLLKWGHVFPIHSDFPGEVHLIYKQPFFSTEIFYVEKLERKLALPCIVDFVSQGLTQELEPVDEE